MDKEYWNECIWRVDQTIDWNAAKYIGSRSRIYSDEVKLIESRLGFQFPGEYLILYEMQKYHGFTRFELYSPIGIFELKSELGVHNVPFSIKDLTLFLWPLYSGRDKKVYKIYDGQSKMHFVSGNILGWLKQVVL